METEKREFLQVLTTTMELYGKPAPSKEVALVWWGKLADYDITQVRRAFDRHISESRFAPMPADIMVFIGARHGHPEPNEAWGIALKSSDEQITVCWTEQIAYAFEAASPILKAGDEVGARMAFLETYKRLINEAQAGPVWRMSYGECPHMRVDAEKQAIKAGLLGAPQSPHLFLPAPKQSADISAKIAELRKMLEEPPKQPDDFEEKKKRYADIAERMSKK